MSTEPLVFLLKPWLLKVASLDDVKSGVYDADIRTAQVHSHEIDIHLNIIITLSPYRKCTATHMKMKLCAIFATHVTS